MRPADIRLLRDKRLLVISEESVAIVTPCGWEALPEELANAVRDVAQADDDAQAPRQRPSSLPRLFSARPKRGEQT